MSPPSSIFSGSRPVYAGNLYSSSRRWTYGTSTTFNVKTGERTPVGLDEVVGRALHAEEDPFVVPLVVVDERLLLEGPGRLAPNHHHDLFRVEAVELRR